MRCVKVDNSITLVAVQASIALAAALDLDRIMLFLDPDDPYLTDDFCKERRSMDAWYLSPMSNCYSSKHNEMKFMSKLIFLTICNALNDEGSITMTSRRIAAATICFQAFLYVGGLYGPRKCALSISNCMNKQEPTFLTTCAATQYDVGGVCMPSYFCSISVTGQTTCRRQYNSRRYFRRYLSVERPPNSLGVT